MIEPNDDLWRALIDFRRRHGRYWKRALSLKWMNGGDDFERFSGSLRVIRNQFGPSWLYNLKPAIIDAAARRIAVFDSLPEMCATRLAGTGEPIVIKRGESGYWPMPGNTTIECLNALFDARPAQIAAMEAGSMFGWTVPGADPARYDDAGRFRAVTSGDKPHEP